jgi:hypothetical protein
MKAFEFYFDGKLNQDGTVDAGLRKLSGQPIDIALCLGKYASESLKKLNDNSAAVIVVNSFLEFLRENPEMKEEAIKRLTAAGSARVSPATIRDMKNIINKN